MLMQANLSMLFLLFMFGCQFGFLGSLGFILILNMVWKKSLKPETQFPSSALSEIIEEIQKK